MKRSSHAWELTPLVLCVGAHTSDAMRGAGRSGVAHEDCQLSREQETKLKGYCRLDLPSCTEDGSIAGHEFPNRADIQSGGRSTIREFQFHALAGTTVLIFICVNELQCSLEDLVDKVCIMQHGHQTGLARLSCWQ